MNQNLEGKIAIVTGGASGIGKATVELFVEHGAKVVIADIQEEAGAGLAERLGDSVAFQYTDVADADSVNGVVQRAVGSFGGLDIMFNNAGVSGGESAPDFLDNDFGTFTRVMAVDLLGPMHGCQAAARYMAEHGGGSIINTASIAGTYAGYGIPDYRAAKAGVIALTRSLAIELGKYDVRVNCISPGATKTDILGFGAELTEDLKEAILKASLDAMIDMQVIKRVGQARDIAEAALFLASDRAAQITGLDLIVDGGASLGDRVNRAAKINENIAAVIASHSHELPT